MSKLFIPRVRDEILIDMIIRYRREIARLTGKPVNVDFNIGRHLRTLLYTVADESEAINLAITYLLDLWDIDKISGQELDSMAFVFTGGRLIRKKALRAGGDNFVAIGKPGKVVPAGSIRIRARRLKETPEYVLRDSITIGYNGMSIATFEAIADGSQFNIPANVDFDIISAFTDVFDIKNPFAISTGQDPEDDVSFRQALKDWFFAMMRGTKTAIKYQASRVEGVAYAQFMSSTPLPGQNTLVIADAQGKLPLSLLNKVKNVIEGDDTLNNAGFRADGIELFYSGLRKVNIFWDMNLLVERNVMEDDLRNIIGSIQDYRILNWRDRRMINRADALKDLQAIDGVKEVLNLDILKLDQPENTPGIDILSFVNPMSVSGGIGAFDYRYIQRALSWEDGVWVRFNEQDTIYTISDKENISKIVVSINYKNLPQADIYDTLKLMEIRQEPYELAGNEYPINGGFNLNIRK